MYGDDNDKVNEVKQEHCVVNQWATVEHEDNKRWKLVDEEEPTVAKLAQNQSK